MTTGARTCTCSATAWGERCRRCSRRCIPNGSDPHPAGGSHRLLRTGVAAEPWTDQHLFDVDAFIDLHRNCPAWFLQSCFLNMRPIQNYFERSLALYEQMDDLQALSYYFAMERWINDNVPVAGETFRQFVKQWYQRNELVRGEFHLRGQPVDLADPLSPAVADGPKRSSGPASRDQASVPTSDPRHRVAGHRSGARRTGGRGKAQRTTWPQATRWLGDRSTATS